ncbi:hypothetical protein HMP09_1984 [Sphingomonas sp. HMP9]|uniref:hypothetical protein n=1 Tax=Sphingomonas sp. HMP9 TaxID=1517554 RepID=UPI0015970E16|nr:hypothetical protein [Sphingomonas sp. HMP9]BCA62750.1 hypothetical protein HMP09_1984 [Sphingomonas sp. HMP9]
MIRGTSISARPLAQVSAAPPSPTHTEDREIERLLTSAEGNSFLRRAPGFLEKRRSSGIDSPRYIQRIKFGSVRYRVSDLLEWEEKHTHLATSDFG